MNGIGLVAFRGTDQTEKAKNKQVETEKYYETTKANESNPSKHALSEDKVELSAKKPEQEHHPVRSFKSFMASLKKFGVGFSEYGSASVAGVAKGAVAGGLTYGALSLVGLIKKNGKKQVAEGVQEAAKAVSKWPKIGKFLAAGIVGTGTLLVSLYDASLKVSERNANIDHKYGVGHDKKEE